VNEPSRLGITPLSPPAWRADGVKALPAATDSDRRQLPVPAESLSNQQMADAIAQQLRQSGLLRHYSIDITFLNGVAELRGHVADAGQRELAMRIVQNVPGVVRVIDRLTVGNNATVLRTTALTPEPSVQAAPLPSRVSDMPLPGGPAASGPATGAPAAGTPNPSRPSLAVSAGGQPPEPTPIFQAPASGFGCAPVPDPFMQPPRMPPYAWPSYAPYNNFSRVAYPTLYPYEAWPFIGPFYPFPKIPPGWRSVTLEWKDGYWWYGKNATGHDWWRIRYW
jgi:hypothetical protein